MRSSKPTCFISYNYDDLDRNTLDSFINWLKEIAENNLDILYDYNLNPGKNLDEFMKMLDEVDAVIIIMTPGYKTKVMNRTGGVYKEFSLIWGRYSAVEDKKKIRRQDDASEDDFGLIPILFSGTHENSVLGELKRIKYADFVNFRVIKGKHDKLLIPDSTQQQYKSEMRKIVDVIRTVNSHNSPRCKDTYNEILFNFVFTELKADWHGSGPSEDFDKVNKKMFVKTYAYRKVETQSGYFLIGRKGSGKSTVTTFIANQDNSVYKGAVHIILDRFNLEMLFGFMSVSDVKSDIKNIVRKPDAFKFAWILFLHICSMDILMKEYLEKRLNPYQESKMDPIVKFLSSLPYGEPETKLTAFYNYSLKSLIEFIRVCIDEARADEKVFSADITANFNVKKFLERSLGKEVVNSFYEIIEVCRRRILITLDGFDTAFDEYRATSIREYYKSPLKEERVSLEIEWLRALLHLVLEIKLDYRQKNMFYNLIDFCITIPQDRFSEVEATERDRYIYLNRCIKLNWSGVELSILLRKRIEAYKNIDTSEKLNDEERLSQIIAKGYPNVPKEISTRIEGKDITTPLFLYVLRHTFWRPRDILFYFASILAVAEDMKKKRYEMTSDVVRRIIKEKTFHVINSEFINEFRSTLTNIIDVINVFKDSNQLISYEELQGILSKVSFNFSYESEEVKDFRTKVVFLYEIGFLGLEINQETSDRYSIKCEHAFYFNEGETPLKAIETPLFGKSNFVIHPIFCEYLQLNIPKQNLILNFTWKYLHEMESIRLAT